MEISIAYVAITNWQKDREQQMCKMSVLSVLSLYRKIQKVFKNAKKLPRKREHHISEDADKRRIFLCE